MTTTALLCCPHCRGRIRVELAPVAGQTKRCQRCREALPLSAYGPRKRSRDGLSYICRSCDSQRVKERRARREDKHAA